MSIQSGFKKVRRRIRLPDGYKLLSFWTSSQTVEMDDGTTLESNKAKWDDSSNKKHEHTNKPALDSITSEKVAKWNTLAESNVTGVKGNAEPAYRTGNVNLTSANIGALPTTGGTLTGNLSFNMNSSTQIPLKVYGGDQYGQGISVGAGGATIVGGGEAAKALESVVSATNEQLHLASDNNIYFDVNCNSIANRLQVVLDKSRNFYPATNNNGSIGTSTYKWANMYATTFHGALDGKSNYLKLNRVTKNASYNPGTNSFVMEEFTDGSTNIPTSHYYHILSGQGADANYVTQLALGMTVDEVRYRNKKAGTWGNWVTLLHSGNVKNYAATPSYVQSYVSSKQPHTHVVTGASGYGTTTNILNGQYLEGTVIIGTAVIYYAGVGYLIYPFNICIARNVGYSGYYLSRANNGNNIYEMQFKFNLAIRNTSSSFYEEVKLVSESSSGYYCSGAQYTVISPS